MFADVISGLFRGMDQVAGDVLAALIPLGLVFVVSQMFILRLRWRELAGVAMGFGFTGIGLLFFLQGVQAMFVPLGEQIGKTLADGWVWWLVPVGAGLGFTAAFADPAVRILNDEVRKATAGAIPGNLILLVLAVGVSFSVALAMVRTILGIPLWWFLVPGFLLALAMLRFVSDEFVAIAFDSGGVATGPMIVTFIVALGVGAASGFPDKDPLLHGFGLVSLVMLTPILSVLTLGAMYGDQSRDPRAKEEKS